MKRQHHPLVIAHRGSSGTAPENTLAAFELARHERADMIELDVWATTDSALAVFHDTTTQRWNGRSEAIKQLAWSQVQELRIRGERVPSLEEVCAWARETGMPLNVELKAAGFEADVATLLRRYGLVEQVIVSSFYPAALFALRAIAPEIARGALMGGSSRPPVRLRERWPLRVLRSLDAKAWHPAVDIPSLLRLVAPMQRRGYSVNVWTIDDPAIMQRLIALGVDGIITNYPARLRTLLDQTA